MLAMPLAVPAMPEPSSQREQTRPAKRAQPGEDEGAHREAAAEGAAEPVAGAAVSGVATLLTTHHSPLTPHPLALV